MLEPAACRMRYLRSWFALDFVSVFPFDAVIDAVISATDPSYGDSSGASSTRLTRLVRLTRLPRLLRLFKFLRARRFLTSWKQPGLVPAAVWRLLFLLLWLCILVHVVAWCLMISIVMVVVVMMLLMMMMASVMLMMRSRPRRRHVSLCTRVAATPGHRSAATAQLPPLSSQPRPLRSQHFEPVAHVQPRSCMPGAHSRMSTNGPTRLAWST